MTVDDLREKVISSLETLKQDFPKIISLQSVINHIKTALDVDPWAADMAEKALKKEIPQKWEYDRPGHWRCPACGMMMGRNVYYNKYCYNCGQKCEGRTADDDNG